MGLCLALGLFAAVKGSTGSTAESSRVESPRGVSFLAEPLGVAGSDRVTEEGGAGTAGGGARAVKLRSMR